MKNSSYWKKRFELIEQHKHDEASSLLYQLEDHYIKAQRQIESQIQSWYQRFADNNEISMAEAKKLLTTKELAEFKWDVKEYIKYGEQNALNQLWMKELENASARFHISRLEALKIQTQQSLEVLFGNQIDDVDSLMKNIYMNDYYHTLYEVQKGFNIGWDVSSIDKSKLEKIISKPWAADGKNFSDRIWNNKSKLVNELHTELTQMAILGKSPDDAIKNIANKMRTSKSNSGKLVMTESAFFSSASQKDAFNDLGVEKFEIVATLDNHTSEICQELDGKVFDMKDYESGVTAPPFHVWCRTTTVPYFDDEFNIGERAARDEDGKTYYIPSNITYPQWKEKFVDGGDKSGLDVVDSDDIIKDETINRFKNIYNEWDGKNIKEFATNIVNSENITLNVQRHQLSGANGQCQLYYNNAEMKILSYELDSNDNRRKEYQIKTVFHELFHAKSNGVTHDIGKISFKDWAYIDDVFAESTAHYITKSIGINKEITPSYARHLIDTLPKLKKLPEFNNCNSIADFGEVAYKYRFSNKLNAEWKPLLDAVNNIELNMIEYSKKYLDYIAENRSDLVEQLLENMPNYSAYKNNMIDDLNEAIKSIKNGYSLSSNEKIVFENALIITMNRLGVK
ncbi:MAG: minor capsid protein [Clostridium argentinense]|nr:minor capsid protein [Clostridium argentinense]